MCSLMKSKNSYNSHHLRQLSCFSSTTDALLLYIEDEFSILKISQLASFLAEAPIDSDSPAAVLTLEFNVNVSPVLGLHQLNQKCCYLVTREAEFLQKCEWVDFSRETL